MNMATDTASLWMRPGRRLLLSSALLFCCLSGGCAGLTPTGQNYPSLSGLFWNRSNKPAEVPGYDDYAAAAAASHPNLQQELAVSRRDNRPGAKDPLQNPSRVELLASSEENQDRGDAPSRRSRSGREADSERTVDSSIRVTLGRPETLQTVDDGPSGEEPALASAPLTNWKRSGASSSMPRQGADGDDPEAVEPARTAVRAPRDDRRVRSAENVERRDQNPPERLASGRQARPASRDEPLRTILNTARTRLAALSTYQVSMTRAERVGGQLQSEENVLLSVRRNPKAVRLEWTNGPSKGREVIYSSTINDRMMYINMANSSLPMPRMSLAVDSPLALRNSRHPITEAGFDTIIKNMTRFMDPAVADTSQEGKLSYKGIQRPKGMDEPCHLIERVTPQGETWQVYLEKRTLMPVVVTAVQTASGELIERYSYRDLKLNPAELASTGAFDPDARWGESKSWLSRLARAGGTPANATSGASTTR